VVYESAEARGELAGVVFRILDDWSVEARDQATLLGLPEGTKNRAVLRLRKSGQLPDGERLEERLHYIVAIDRALDNLLPHNAPMARYWITTPYPLFGDVTPLSYMLARGVSGMAAVLAELNGTAERY
jgi:hypothetical protein